MTGTDATADERGRAEGTAETVEPVHKGEPVGTRDRSERLNFTPGPRRPKRSSAREEDIAKRLHDKILKSLFQNDGGKNWKKGAEKNVTVNRKMAAGRLID